MAIHKLAITRAKNYPFLTLQTMAEGRGLDGTIDLTGDEYADYEETVKKFAFWQNRLSSVGAEVLHAEPSKYETVDVGAPAGGALA